MKKTPRKTAKRTARAQLKALERELDRVYARLRERARYEWALRQAREQDPADSRVSVRITATSKPVRSGPPSKRKPRQRLLLPKRTKPHRKISRATRRGLK